jgi:hypothetical protein
LAGNPTVFSDVDDTRYPEKCGIDLEEPAISTFITPLLIYVLTPILGVGVFWALIHKMRSAMVVSPPVVPYHSFFHTRRLVDCAAYGLVLGVVGHGLAGNAVFDPRCSYTHGIYVLAPPYST